MRKIKDFFQKNERWLTPVALAGGFVLDNLTIRRSDLLIENVVVGIYFFVILVGLVLWQKIESFPRKSVRSTEIQSITFLIVQFAFGGLFSALTVFYIKSASILVSWPFLLLLFGGMIATEYLKKHFYLFLVQLGTLYLLLFTYLIMITPLLFRQINSIIFVISGVVSLCIFILYLMLFYRVVPQLFHNRHKQLAVIVGGIFLSMNMFYFLNIIPPIPLALRDSGVYQGIKKEGNDYKFSYFDSSFSFKKFEREYQVKPGEPVYFFSAIYAPIKFQQRIVHEWQKKNSEGDWVKVAVVNFPIFGGSDHGYRGYSLSNQVTSGEWRVLVKTNGGQVLGEESFSVK